MFGCFGGKSNLSNVVGSMAIHRITKILNYYPHNLFGESHVIRWFNIRWIQCTPPFKYYREKWKFGKCCSLRSTMFICMAGKVKQQQQHKKHLLRLGTFLTFQNIILSFRWRMLAFVVIFISKHTSQPQLLDI